MNIFAWAYSSLTGNITSEGIYGEVMTHFAILSGYGSIKGYVKDMITNEPISNANITIIHFGYGEKYYNETDENGYYSFNFIPPGFYVIIAYHPDYKAIGRVVYLRSDEILYVNLSLINASGGELILLMKKLYFAFNESLDKLANKMGEITESFPKLIGDETDAWDILSFAGDIMTTIISPSAAAQKHAATAGKAFYKAWGEAIKKAIKQEIWEKIIEFSTQQALDNIILSILNESMPTTEELKQSQFYLNLAQSLENEYNGFFEYIQNASISNDFDIERTTMVINTEEQEIKKMEEKRIIIISLDPSNPYRYFSFPASYEGYMKAKQTIEDLGLTKNVLVGVQIGACVGSVVAIVATKGVATPAVIYIFQGISTAKTITEIMEMAAKSGAPIMFVNSLLTWIRDSGTLPTIYNETANIIKKGAISSYYLNKNYIFDADVAVDINADYVDWWGNKWIWVPWFAAKKTADVTVKNTGNVASWIRIYLEGFEDRINLSSGATKYYTIPFIATHIPVIDLFRDKWIKADVYSGVLPYPVDHDEDKYRTTMIKWWLWRDKDADNITLKASTSSGILTLSDYINLSSQTIKIMDVNLTIENPEIEINYTVGNSYQVEFRMFYPSISNVDLHVYDQNGYHVGYNYASNQIEIGFPAIYGGRYVNPQIITIPCSAGKTFNIKAKLVQAISENESYHITIYATEIPYRPAVLSAEPPEIKILTKANETVSIPIFFGEAGGQNPLYNVTVSISNITGENNSLIVTSQKTINIGTMLANSTATTSFIVYIQENASGNYTGYITIGADNAENITIDVIITVDKKPPSIIPNPTVYPNLQQAAKTNDTIILNVTATDDYGILTVLVNVSSISSYEQIELEKIENSSYYKAELVIDKAIPSGEYYLPILAIDKAGNINDTEEIFVLIDNTPPQIMDVVANPDRQVINGTVNISCKVLDNVGIKDVKIYINFPNNFTLNQSMANIPGTSIYYYNSTYIIAGNYTYFIWANDTSGNSIYSDIYQFKILSIDYIAITFSTKNEILDYNISTNFSFIAYSSAFNYTYGFIEFVEASWSIINYDSNATINASYGKSIKFNSGINDGIAILKAEYNGFNDTVVFQINSSIFSFFFYKGWNLITIPYENNFTAKSLGNAISQCNIIAKWNSSIQQYQSYLVGISPPEFDFEIEDGKGYFIYLKNNTIFSIKRNPIENVSIPLHIGWNLIGWFKNATMASLLEIENCSIIAKWNASMQQFQSYLVGISPPEYDFVIRKGMGIFIYTTKESIWYC